VRVVSCATDIAIATPFLKQKISNFVPCSA
jgi:hypothetical protein